MVGACAVHEFAVQSDAHMHYMKFDTCSIGVLVACNGCTALIYLPGYMDPCSNTWICIFRASGNIVL